MEIAIWHKSFGKLYWSEIVNDRKTDPGLRPLFPNAGNLRKEISRICLYSGTCYTKKCIESFDPPHQRHQIACTCVWEVKADIIQCIHLCFCMLAISLYFVNCVIISCKLSFNSRFTRNQIPIMSFLGFKKAELGCKMSELHLYVVKRQNWVVIIRKWICFNILTPEGAPILLAINNFSHASRTRCKRC